MSHSVGAIGSEDNKDKKVNPWEQYAQFNQLNFNNNEDKKLKLNSIFAPNTGAIRG